MTTKTLDYEKGERSREVNKMLVEQAQNYILDALVDDVLDTEKPWDPFANPKLVAAEPVTASEVKQKPVKEALTDEQIAEAKKNRDKWAQDNHLLHEGESLLSPSHEFTIGKTYHFHWIWKKGEDGVERLYLAVDEKAKARLPEKPTADGREEMARILKRRRMFDNHIAEVAMGADVGTFVANWENQLGINGGFSAVSIGMLYRYQRHFYERDYDQLVTPYMSDVLPRMSLMGSRDGANWEAAAAYAVISGAMTRDQAIQSYMIGRSISGIRARIGEAIRLDVDMARVVEKPDMTDRVAVRKFLAPYLQKQIDLNMPQPASVKLPKDAPTVADMDEIIAAYNSTVPPKLENCYGANARFWGRMVISEYYLRRTEELRTRNWEPEDAAIKTMAEIVMMTTFNCLPGTKMMDNIQAMTVGEINEIVRDLIVEFTPELEAYAQEHQKPAM